MKALAVGIVFFCVGGCMGPGRDPAPVASRAYEQGEVVHYCDPPVRVPLSRTAWRSHLIGEVLGMRSEDTDGTYQAAYTVDVQPRESIEGEFPSGVLDVRVVVPWDTACTPASGERVPYLGEPLEIFIDAEGNVALWNFILPYSSRDLTFDAWQGSAQATPARRGLNDR